MQGTWADNIIIQAVADALSLKIHIIESNENFTERTLVETANTVQNIRSIYIGHLEETLYFNVFTFVQKKLKRNWQSKEKQLPRIS